MAGSGRPVRPPQGLASYLEPVPPRRNTNTARDGSREGGDGSCLNISLRNGRISSRHLQPRHLLAAPAAPRC